VVHVGFKRGSAVGREAVDGTLAVFSGGQAVGPGGFDTSVTHELGDQDEVVAVADESCSECVA